MSFLIINGNAYEVISTGGAQRRTPVRIGSATRAAAGNLRLQYSAEKRVWSFPLAPLTEAQDTTLVADTALGVFVTCSGSALKGASVTCSVEIGETQYVDDRQTVLYLPTVTLTEK